MILLFFFLSVLLFLLISTSTCLILPLNTYKKQVLNLNRVGGNLFPLSHHLACRSAPGGSIQIVFYTTNTSSLSEDFSISWLILVSFSCLLSCILTLPPTVPFASLRLSYLVFRRTYTLTFSSLFDLELFDPS